MNILIIDDENILLKHLEKRISELLPKATIYTYNNYSEIINNINNEEIKTIDIAFLDIKINGMSGIDLAQFLQKRYKKINIIFTTGYDNYAIKAFNLNASGYLLKPITTENLKNALLNLRYPINEKIEDKITFQCFGNFEVFIESKPINFKFTKTKELLGYLVYKRGALCSNEEIISNLWDDLKEHNSYFKQLRKDLYITLEKYNCKNVIIRQRGKMGININNVNCDYYDYVKGNKATIIKEFMSQYSWAEEITALL